MAINMDQKFLFMTDEPPTAFHRFTELPKELRIIISEAIVANFTRFDYIDERQHAQILHSDLLSLLTVQEDFSGTVSKAYYGLNTFSIVVSTQISAGFMRNSEFLRPKPQTAMRIKHLLITVSNCVVDTTLEDMFMVAFQGWRWLLRPTRQLAASNITRHWHRNSRAADSNRETAWQGDFTYLNTLEIIFHAHVDGTRQGFARCFDDARWAQLDGWLADTEILLRARKQVKIVVRSRTFQHEICEEHGQRCPRKDEEQERRCTRLEEMAKIE